MNKTIEQRLTVQSLSDLLANGFFPTISELDKYSLVEPCGWIINPTTFMPYIIRVKSILSVLIDYNKTDLITKQMIQNTLIQQMWFINDSTLRDYQNLVKKLFKNNELRINHWLEYGKNQPPTKYTV